MHALTLRGPGRLAPIPAHPGAAPPPALDALSAARRLSHGLWARGPFLRCLALTGVGLGPDALRSLALAPALTDQLERLDLSGNPALAWGAAGPWGAFLLAACPRLADLRLVGAGPGRGADVAAVAADAAASPACRTAGRWCFRSTPGWSGKQT